MTKVEAKAKAAQIAGDYSRNVDPTITEFITPDNRTGYCVLRPDGSAKFSFSYHQLGNDPESWAVQIHYYDGSERPYLDIESYKDIIDLELVEKTILN